MANIRMNPEYRAKIVNRFTEHLEEQNSDVKKAYLKARKEITKEYPKIFKLAKKVVLRAYPTKDVETCQKLKKKYGEPLDVVAKDKCFYFSCADDIDDTIENEYGRESSNYSEHFDFGLFGTTEHNEYSGGHSGKKFAYAYYRDELKAEGCNPDVYPQHEGNQDNPNKSMAIEKNDLALGYDRYSSYNSERDNTIGIARDFDQQWYLDIIGVSHCRSRTIACTEAEFTKFQMFKKQKAQLYMAHFAWVDLMAKQIEKIKTGLQAYKTLIEGVELMKQFNIKIDEADLVKVNSTGLTVYDPVNLADMVKGMASTTMTREQKIAERLKYESENSPDTLVVVSNPNSSMVD